MNHTIYPSWRIPDTWKVSGNYTVPVCAPFWSENNCFFCVDNIINMAASARYIVYFLDLLAIIAIVGMFCYRPSEILEYLRGLFPEGSTGNRVLSYFLIGTANTSSNVDPFFCASVNMFYLFEIAVALWAVYRIVDTFLYGKSLRTAKDKKS